MSSDHFAPWSERQGESGFAWSFLGAALAQTSLPFGIVNAPGQRYHPAIIAQAAATLCEMFPQRLWIALGTGEASNEHITGEGWPPKGERTERLRGVRRDHAGAVPRRGGLALRARRRRPRAAVDAARDAAGAAVRGGERGDRSAGDLEWADGLATVNAPVEHLRRMLDAFGSEGRKVLQVHVSWAPTQEEAVAIAYDQWRTNVFDPPICWDLETPEAFDVASQFVRPEDVAAKVLVSSDLAQHVAWLQEYAALGFDDIALHHVGQDLDAFIDAFGSHVLPELA